ncbi:MAG TPA: hypothetical protein GXX25_00380 [Desulfotomaculum sp.]|nr:hypothetical protein [Desulfotomaculum sp.]
MKNRIVNYESGFTLMELVIGTALAGLLLGVVFQCLQLGVRSWLRQEQQLDVQDNLRITLELVAAELRLSLGVGAVKSDELCFQRLKGDKRVTVRYYVANGALIREEDGGHPPVASRIKSLQIRYFQPDNQETTDPALVSRVEVILTAGAAGVKDTTLRTSVQLRCKGQ